MTQVTSSFHTEPSSLIIALEVVDFQQNKNDFYKILVQSMSENCTYSRSLEHNHCEKTGILCRVIKMRITR
jgi:hypothetical protein